MTCTHHWFIAAQSDDGVWFLPHCETCGAENTPVTIGDACGIVWTRIHSDRLPPRGITLSV